MARSPSDSATREPGPGSVYGENDDVGITRDEREVLAGASHVTLIEIADTGHFALNQKPDEIAAIVLQAVSSATG
jgi:pimeloyl-ACP methyl ester carboxylesterase